MKIIENDKIPTLITEQVDKMQNELINSTLVLLEPQQAHAHCSSIVEGIDVVFNLVTEIGDKHLCMTLMQMSIDSIVDNSLEYQAVKPYVVAEIGTMAIDIFEKFILDFKGAIRYLRALKHPQFIHIANGLSTVSSIFLHISKRRRYYVTFLSLIPHYSKGKLTYSKEDFLGLEMSHIEMFMVPMTTGRDILLMNSCYEDFVLTDNNGMMTWNKNFTHLEQLYLEPQRLTLLDEMTLREIDCDEPTMKKPSNQMFSFLEVENAVTLYKCVFEKYSIEKITAFTQIIDLVPQLKQYVIDDYRIIVPKGDFEKLESRFPLVNLVTRSDNYFDHLNSTTPFSFTGTHYYSNVMLLVRLITNLVHIKLERHKRYQVHSGFIFEDRVIKKLEEYGFVNSGVTRINHKEFDLVMTRDNVIHNFQCKNNTYEISLIDMDYVRMSRINKRLCKYYKTAYDKELGREQLIKDKLDLSTAHHYVVSRFPVLTNQDYVINFNELDNWLKKNFSKDK